MFGGQWMPAFTYHVALPFVKSEAGLVPGDAVECVDADLAVVTAMALSMSKDNVGAIAFSRTGDSVSGEFSDAVIVEQFGEVPSDLTMLY